MNIRALITAACLCLLPTVASAADCPGTRRKATANATSGAADAAISRAEARARRIAEESCAGRDKEAREIRMRSSVQTSGDGRFTARASLVYGCRS